MEKNFLELSEQELIKIADEIENNDKNSLFDVEYSDGILNIEIFKTGAQYVVNKHSASQKIWFSSPISGANYFSFNNEKEKWLDEKGMELRIFLLNELSSF